LETHYNESPYHFLSAVYPDYNWLPWKFVATPKGFWANLNNQRKFLDWAADEMKIVNTPENREAWYKVSQKVFFHLELFFQLEKNILIF
jgi:hypothetical protein